MYETGIHALRISKIKSGLIYIKSVFEEFKKPYWLAAGTYLGEFITNILINSLYTRLNYRLV